MAGKGGAIRAGKAYYELGGQTDPLRTALKGAEGMVRKSVGGIRSAYSGAKALLGKAGLSAAIGAASTALASILPGAAVKHWAEIGTELTNSAKRANTTAAALGSLGYAARQTGADVGTMEAALKTVRDKIVEAARGSDEAQLAFARLNLNFLTLSRMKPDDALRAIAQRLNAIPNQALRAAAATELLGSADLLPTLERLQEMEARAKRLGIVMNTADAAAAQKFDQSLTDLFETVKSVGNALAMKLAPPLEKLVQKGTEFSVRIREWINTSGAVEAVVNVVEKLLDKIVSVGKVTADLDKVSKLAWAQMKWSWGLGIATLEASWDLFTTAIELTWKNTFRVVELAGSAFVSRFQQEWNSATALVAKRLIDIREIAGWAGLPGGISTPEANAQRGTIRKENDAANAKIEEEAQRRLDEFRHDQQREADAFAKRTLARGIALAPLLAERNKLLAELKAGQNNHADANNKLPIPNAKNNLTAAANGGIAQALLNVKGLGAQDVRTKEGFASVSASLRQQSIAADTLYYTRRTALALEKLGVLTN